MTEEQGIFSTEELRLGAIRAALEQLSATAITAPKSGGQLFLLGGQPFIEAVGLMDKTVQARLAEWMRRRGAERREAIWFRDAEAAERMDAILFIGLKDWYPPVYDCGACGYATCAEFLNATKELRQECRVRVRRAPVQPQGHRPRDSGRLRCKDSGHPRHRCPLPDPGGGCRAETRDHRRGHRDCSLHFREPQELGVRPHNANDRF